MAAVQRTPTPITSSGGQRNFVDTMEGELHRRHHRRRSSGGGGLNGTIAGGEAPLHLPSRTTADSQRRARSNNHPFRTGSLKWGAADRGVHTGSRTFPSRSMSQGEYPRTYQIPPSSQHSVAVAAAASAIPRSPPSRELSSSASGSDTASTTDSLASPEPEVLRNTTPLARVPLHASPPPLAPSDHSPESFTPASTTATDSSSSSREWSLSPQALTIHHTRSRSTSDHRFLLPSDLSLPAKPSLSASHDDILNASDDQDGTWRRNGSAAKLEARHRYSDRCQHKTLVIDGRQIHHSMMRVPVKKESASLLRAELRRSFRQDKRAWLPGTEKEVESVVEKVLSGPERRRTPASDEEGTVIPTVASTKGDDASMPTNMADRDTSLETDQKGNEDNQSRNEEVSSQKQASRLQGEGASPTGGKARSNVNAGTTGEEVSGKMAGRPVPRRTASRKNQVDDYNLPECKEVHPTATIPGNEDERLSHPAEVHSLMTSPRRKEEPNRADEEDEQTLPPELSTISPALSRSYKELQGFLTMSAGLQKSRREAELEETVNRLRIQLRSKQKEKAEADEAYHRDLRVRDEKIKKLNKDNARLEREKWELLRRAREAAERSVNLRTKLDLHDSSLRSVQQELQRVTDELLAVKSANNSLRLLVTDLRTPTPKADACIQVELASLSPAMQRSHSRGNVLAPHNLAEIDTGGLLGRLATEFSNVDDWDEASIDGSSHTDSRDGTPTTTPQLDRRGRERKSMRKLLSKFRRSSSSGKAQNSTTSLDNLRLSQNSLTHPHSMTTTTPFSLPGESAMAMPFSRASSQRHSSSSIPASLEQADSQAVLQESKQIPFHQWNTRALVAWMDIVVGMPRYISVLRENVTSGHALLALTNSDLERRLGIIHPLHRRRLRLCIEEERASNFKSLYPAAAELDHKWVSYSWAVDCGLAHLSALLYNGLVDGRVLNSLTKEDLKKYFKLTKKIQQLSFLSGVELLRMHDFKLKTIHAHRQTTNNPLYWTNKDIGEWLTSIGLAEYSNNIIGSGVHGALLFLERSQCSSDQLATILHIPSGKARPRRHLAVQLAQLFASEDLNGSAVVDDVSPVDVHVTLTSPTSNRTPTTSPISPSPIGRDHSPHPHRRMSIPSDISCSDPDLARAARASRNDVARRSLRETVIQSTTTTPPPTATALRSGRSRSHALRSRPHSHMLTNTTIV